MNTKQALDLLKAGNARFVSGALTPKDNYATLREQLSAGQHPFAVVLCCSDSRVAPEIIFDQKLGDLFVIRNAGNIVDEEVLGSIEYAVCRRAFGNTFSGRHGTLSLWCRHCNLPRRRLARPYH